MYCVVCWNTDTKVVDSRASEDGKSIRRRRECWNCNHRFTTFEKIELIKLVVVKSGNRRVKYNRDKLEDSLLKATNKRKISFYVIDDMISRLEYLWNPKQEITSKDMWRDILGELKKLDEVSYIRYASVHLNFSKTEDFIEFISKN